MPRTKGSKNAVPGTVARAWAKLPAARKKEILKARAEGRKRKHIEKQLAWQQKYDAAPTAEELQVRIYKQLEANPLLWGHFFFPNHFRIKTPAFHLDIIGGAMENRHLGVAAPRESSKSTLLGFLYPFHRIYFKKVRFIIHLANTFKKAAMSLDTIKSELRDNQRLQDSLPKPIEIVRDAEGDSEFRHPDGFTTKVLCKGVDQIGSIRGVKFGAHRPDLMIIDDLEDDELVRNPLRRRDLQDMVDEALIPAGEAGKCQFIWIGTVLHDDSQLAKVVLHSGKYPEYKKLFFQAHLDPDGPNEASLWPEKWSVDKLKQLRKQRPLVYAKEYQNDPVAGQVRVFKKADFRIWKRVHDDYVLMDPSGTQVVARGALEDCKAAIACDLAWEQKRQADFCVILPGLLTPQSELLIWPYIAEKGLRPNQIEEMLFMLESQLRAITKSVVPIGFEKAKLEKVIRWLLRQAMRRRNHPLLLKDLIWDADKFTRIETRLQSRYAQNMIYHLPGMGELEDQLLRFPSGAYDDLPDAEQGLIQLLQYPKQRQAPKPELDEFEVLRQIAIQSRKPKTGMFQINGRPDQGIIPARITPFKHFP